MEDVHQPERFQEQNGIHENRMVSQGRLPEWNEIEWYYKEATIR
jgi:hypothetical protein